MAVIALETAIKNPGCQVHFGAPFQNALRDFLLPIFRQIMEDCPADLLPDWKHQESKFVLKNSSCIKLCGANNNQFDNLRGNKSDLFILDEAGQIDELESVVRDVALPQLLSSTNPNKKLILASTPPNTPDHPFKKYGEQAIARNAYSHHTIHEGWYPPHEIERYMKESGGAESTTWRREYLAEFCTDSVLQIIPEWKTNLYVKEIPKDDYFQFWKILEGLDVGYRDFTAWILGYYNFNTAQLVIEYELALKENDFTTKELARGIKEAEKEYRQLNRGRFRRIADNNNLNLLADLSRLYEVPFQPVSKKQGKSWMVNQLRLLVNSNRLVVHPRCKMLIASLDFGIWKRNLEEFDRSKELGHYDFIDALTYLVAVLLPAIEKINPVPPLYQIDVSKTMFPGGLPRNNVDFQDETIRKLFKV